jgi:predicted DNA-binding transcriptional regulator AlpA
VRNLHREGRLPQRIAISERLVGWRENELEAWLSSRREDDTDV